MTQEEKQLLLKDICARLPYGVMVQSVGENKILGLSDLSNPDLFLPKPYLRLLSSMTDDEDKEWQSYKCSIAESCDRRLEEKINALYDWFNARHLDWRGLIPKGLAIEAPEGMYKTE